MYQSEIRSHGRQTLCIANESPLQAPNPDAYRAVQVSTLSGHPATEVYDRYNYDPEKRTALDKWGRHLDTLIGGATPSRLVSFPDRRR